MFAYDYSPYYRKAFEAKGITRENIKTMPLEHFPVLDKGILMEYFDELVTDRSLKQEELLSFDKTAKDEEEVYEKANRFPGLRPGAVPGVGRARLGGGVRLAH